MLDTGLLDTGYWSLDAGYWSLDAGCGVKSGLGVEDTNWVFDEKEVKVWIFYYPKEKRF